jgi:hypothetical protein
MRRGQYALIDHLIPVAPAPASAMRPEANSNRFQFPLGHANRTVTSDAGKTSKKRSMTDFGSHFERCGLESLGLRRDNPVYQIHSRHPLSGKRSFSYPTGLLKTSNRTKNSFGPVATLNSSCNPSGTGTKIRFLVISVVVRNIPPPALDWSIGFRSSMS